MRGFLPLLVAALLFAGCLEGHSSHPSTPTPPATTTTPSLLSYDGEGNLVATPPAFTGLHYSTVPIGYGGEPNIGVTSQGNAFVTGFEQTYRSTDHGKSWAIVFDQTQQLGPVPSNAKDSVLSTSDPMLWVDPFTDRVYTDHMLSLACSNLSWSDDEGATWTFRPVDCGILVNDHQKLATAPWHGPAPQPTSLVHNSVLYYCYNKLVATDCAVSLDGGLTYAYDRPVTVAPNPPADGTPAL